MRFELCPVYAVGEREITGLTNQPDLPFQISEGLTLENVKQFLNPKSFEVWERAVGDWTHEKIVNLQYALVYRYESDASSTKAVEYACELLRLIRPMRQPAVTYVQGEIRSDGSFDVKNFRLTHSQRTVDVPVAHQHNGVRFKDVEVLKELLPRFVRAIDGEFWKFRIANQLYTIGYLQVLHWKPKFLLWMTAIEAIYTSQQQQGSLLAKSRICWFLGGKTSIYGDLNSRSATASLSCTLDDILEDLFSLRNLVAHGDRVPNDYAAEFLRHSGRGIPKADVLIETASFIIRSSLLKILEEDLLENFEDSDAAESYFRANGLVRSNVSKRLMRSKVGGASR